MMPLDQALALPGLRVATWDRSAGDSMILQIVVVENRRAKLVARETVPASRRAELERRLRERGVVTGATDRGSKFIWVFGESTANVWQLDDDSPPPLEGVGASLKVRGEHVAAPDVGAVVSFDDEDDRGHRGVKLELKTNKELVIAEERDLEVDGGWISHLGRELAAALRVPHRDELHDTITPPPASRDAATDAFVDGLIAAYYSWDEPGRVAARAAAADEKNRRDAEILELSYVKSGQRGSAPMDVAVRRMCDYFASRLDEAADSGALAGLYQPLPELENGGYIALDLKTLDGALRRLELRVESPSGENKAAEVVREGTTGDLIAFLRSSSIAETLIPLMEKLTESTREG